MNECRYCNDAKNSLGFYLHKSSLIWEEIHGLALSTWIGEGQLFSMYEEDSEEVLAGSIQIHYCPMCGRKL